MSTFVSQARLRRAEAATWGPAPSPGTAKILRWRASPDTGTLLGYFDAEFPSGMQIYGLKLMAGKARGYWIGMPSIKQTNRDGSVRTDLSDKALWSPIIDFAGNTARDRFRDLVIDALRRDFPDAFGGET